MKKLSRKNLIEEIWKFVQKREKDFPTDIKTKRKDIEGAVFKIEGELRISGEVGNNFSGNYVNYYDASDVAEAMQSHLWKHGFEVEWYNPAYMVL